MRIPVDECEAGYWMDMAIAQAIDYADDDVREFNFLRRPLYRKYKPFFPSADAGITDELVDMMIESGGVFLMGCYTAKNGGGFCTAQLLMPGAEFVSTAETRTLAICRVFLKVSGMEYIEIADEPAK